MTREDLHYKTCKATLLEAVSVSVTQCKTQSYALAAVDSRTLGEKIRLPKTETECS